MNRPRPPVRTARRAERGVAAIELAIILTQTFVLLPAIFLFCRVFYQYNVLKQATHDAAQYVAALPPGKIRNKTAAADASNTAKAMVVAAANAANINPVPGLSEVAVLCDAAANCSGTTEPGTVRVSLQLTLTEIKYSGFTAPFLDKDYRWTINADSTVAYAH